jgi:hypothetical protein
MIDACFLQDLSDNFIICACNICQLREYGMKKRDNNNFGNNNNRRRLNSNSNSISESFEAAAITHYAISEFISVN